MKDMSQIEVSIIIPTFNRKESLKKTLNSLFDQTYPAAKYEVIVCDDNRSKDGTEGMVKKLMMDAPCDLRYFKVIKRGIAAARNVGVENARGEIVGFTDDDCVVSSTWIEAAIKYFEDTKISGIAGMTIPIKEYEEKGLFTIVQTREFKEEGDYAACNIFYRKKALVEVGGFNEEFVMAREDADLALRLKEKNNEISFGKDLIVYHDVIIKSIIPYLKSLKRWKYEVLFLREHPESEVKKDLIFGFINKRHFYPIFFVLFITFLMINIFYAYIFLLFGVLSYLWSYVLIDSNVKKYPLRIIHFIRHFIPDLIRLYYTIRGSIRYRCLFI